MSKASYARRKLEEAQVKAKENQLSYDMGLNEGIRRGKKAAEDDFKYQQQVIDGKLKAMNAVSQAICSLSSMLDNMHGMFT